jgi:hypothetical protein
MPALRICFCSPRVPMSAKPIHLSRPGLQLRTVRSAGRSLRRSAQRRNKKVRGKSGVQLPVVIIVERQGGPRALRG